MKSIKERINSNPKEQQDDTDGSVNYDKLNEERLPGEDFETDENTGETEFYNPVFKPRPVYNSNLGVEENYDQLNFTPRSTPKASPNLPRKQQVNAEKQNEDIEMMGVKAGVNNYGYIHERKRPDSWESDLSAINPISTAIRNPVNIPSRRIPSVGMEMSESPPRDYSNSVSKQSAYSSVANNSNPYLMSGDKDPQYEVLPRVQANKQALEPRPSGGNKKINMLYESAVITEKSASSEKYRKRTSIDQEAASYDEGSNCCHLLFTILTGILAIVALVIVFLMVFGVINPNCKDCDSSSSASTSAQAQSVDIQLKELSANLTQLKNDLHTNSSDVITSLRKELEDQKALVASLTQQLETQKQFTEQLNSTMDKVRRTVLENSEKTFKVKTSVQSNTASINTNNRKIIETQGRITNVDSDIRYVRTNVEKEVASLKADLTLLKADKLDKKDFTKHQASIENEMTITERAVVQISGNVTSLNGKVKLMKNEISHTLDTNMLKIHEEQKEINNTIYDLSNKILNISLMPGPRGPRGFNGSQGDIGLPGKPADFTSCSFEQRKMSSKIDSNWKYKQIKVYAAEDKGSRIIGATCSHGQSAITNLLKMKSGYMCICENFPEVSNTYECVIDYWICRN